MLKNAYILMASVFLADRASKWWIVHKLDLPSLQDVAVLPFFSLTMVWNRGISMGLFQAGDDFGKWLLIILTGLVTVGLFIWMRRETSQMVVLALAAIVGGSLANIWDRIQYGAVADFLHFHVAGYSFYVFNVADAAISLGVMVLLWDALLSPQKNSKTK